MSMTGRDIGVVTAAFAVMITAGLVGAAENHQQPASVALPEYPPPKPVVVHEVITHTVTKVVSGSPLSGWQIMLIAIVAIIVGAGTMVALHYRRPE